MLKLVNQSTSAIHAIKLLKWHNAEWVSDSENYLELQNKIIPI